jgi:DNA modification methylase
MITAQILVGDVRQRLAEIPDASVQTCITSPPYWGLRDYGEDGQIGLEQTPDEYVAEMVTVFREVRRVLADDGTLWLNLGDSYAGSGRGPEGNLAKHQDFRYMQNKTGFITPNGLKPKDLVGIPWRVAFALQADGWWLRQDIIWHKPNPMPESVTDRCTKAHEYLFLLTKSAKYYYDSEAIKEESKWSNDNRAGAGRLTYKGKRQGIQGTGQEAFVTITEKRNKRSVWTITIKPFKGAHFAVMPEALVEPCILAGSREGDLVLDPFTGAATTAVVALRHGRNFIGTELNKQYAEIAQDRLENEGSLFHQVIVK